MATSSVSRYSDIKNKLSTGEYILLDVAGKSEIWKRFKLVAVKESGESIGFVQCEKCLIFLSYNSSKSGTSHLRRHNCIANSSNKLTSFFKPQSRNIDKKDKETLLQASVEMCCKDLRPFDIVSGEGFVNFAQTLVNIGVKNGNINVTDILPHPTTISRHVTETADNLRSQLVLEINKKVKEGLCAASTDMWTDDYRKKSFVAVTVHYFDDDWQLASKLLYTCDFPNERKTGINIRKELFRRFSQFGLNNDAIEKITFVTDRGSNIINALEPFKRLDCMAHIINTVLRNLFQADYLKENNLKVFETLIGAKSLVTYMKQSGLVTRLSKSVHQDSETRWNSKLEMLLSVYELYEEISAILLERGEECRLQDIHLDVLPELIKFLEPFKDACLSLEKEEKITLPLVLLWQKKLLSGCEFKPDDEDFIKDLKSRCKELIKEKYVLKDEHKLATFLCPSFRQLRMLTENERKDVMNIVVKNLDEVTLMDTQLDDTVVNTPPVSQTSEETTKRKKIEKDFMEWQDQEEVLEEKNEIDIYCSLKAPLNPDDVNAWWKSHQRELKKLSKLAQRILCIPATSASCERNFSTAGYLIHERRTRLNPEVIDATLFLHDNL